MHKTVTTFIAAAAMLGFAAPALASDHLANGATAPGAAQRDFGNPVAGTTFESTGR